MTSRIELTASPINLVADQSLTSGASYSIEAAFTRRGQIWEGAAAPVVGTRDRRSAPEIRPGGDQSRRITVGSQPIWAWSDEPGGATITISDG